MTQYAYLIPVFPFIAFVINIFFGKRMGKLSAGVSVLTSLISCAIALPCVFSVIGHHGEAVEKAWEWVPLGSYSLQFGYLLDPLSVTVLFFVAIIGTLIQIYSIGYMEHDARFSRFFAYVSLFMSAMLTLTISNNYILFFMAWEVMGLCSYLLIGFWFEKDSAADAGRKAFLTTRVGDVGFFLGMMTLFVALGTFNFSELSGAVQNSSSHLIPLAGLLIFCGTMGKSAQVPLHVWLPDAMEGPTPVSALIHAATMVAAGVYLVARSIVVFEVSETVMMVVAITGTLTAFMAAFIALSATDIKKVLAYSTISQLGYCVTAMGLGGYIAGFFHLGTHAFFKALLFLGAGSVIHGTGTQDMRKMGGLLPHMKHTGWTFIIAAVAIAGIPPFSGFWSKDEILLYAFKYNKAIYVILSLTAFMTAFYMFRAVFMTFFGKPKDSSIHPHESPATMTAPLWVLAIGAILVGIPGSPIMDFWFQHFIEGPDNHSKHYVNWFVMSSSIVFAVLGILLAYLIYYKNNGLNEKVTTTFKPLHRLSENKLWIDEIYEAFIIRPFKAIGDILFVFDQKVVDRLVNDTGKSTVKTADVKHWIDKYIVDGLVNLTGYTTQFASAVFRRLQTGFVQHYLLVLFIGALVMICLELKS